MNSNYISPKSNTYLHQRAIGKILCLIVVALSVIGIAGIGATALQQRQEAQAFDPIQWLACRFGEDSKPDFIYQVTQGSELQFELFSKSHSGSGQDDVRGGLNGVLDYIMTDGDPDSPYSFEAVNERIIGQDFAGTLPIDENSYKRWNKGATVNPYNRFGVAGLKFSNYMGEWKHLFINACDDSDKPTANYDTGASTNIVKVASWNVCSFKGVCNLPDFNNPLTGQPFTPDEIWDDFSERVTIGASREMQEIDPDILLGQEVTSAEPGGEETFYTGLCGATGMEHIETNFARKICYNPEKFTPITNDEYEGAQGEVRFSAHGLGPLGGFAWAVMEDQSYRRSVFISIHLAPSEERAAIRKAQTEFLTDWIEKRFSASFYPIVVGGDWNAFDPKSCDTVGQLPAIRRGPAQELCNAGFNSTNALATTPVDLEKASFQAFTPWKSKEGPHLDHIWVNGYVGVGESRVFAPAGPAMSDHAMVSATVNLNGTSVASPGDPQDPQTNKYYDTRIEPRSTWEDINTSADVRTLQFSRGFGDRFTSSISVNFTNGVFFLTKLIVVFTIALIGLAFSDIGSFLGLTDLVAGTDGQPGLFTQLHNNIFVPLIVISIMATGIYLFYTAIVKRQIRQALGDTLKAVICFFIAVIISVSPAWFVSLPNNVAVVVQALVADSLDSSLVGGNGLCDSNVAYSDTILAGTEGTDVADPDAAAGLLERASINMQSSTGCMLWYNLLLRPWSEGQFGSEYNELYGTVGGKCVSNVNPDEVDANDPQNYGPEGKHVCLGYNKEDGKNRNYLWVGDPIVPLGGGRCTDDADCDAKLESNWALLQISTQTNAHAPILPPEDRGVGAKYSQGVAHDWWRIVDAVSNYHEEVKTDNVCKEIDCTQIPAGTKTAPFPQALKTDTMNEWNSWVGNNEGHRVATVFSSLLIAFIGTLAPLVFSTLSVLYAVGIALLMAFAPIFFLFGCWAGRGWNLFKAWADLVINTTLKRIATGVLTVLSISFVAAILEQMDNVGYWKSMILLVIISLALVKSRQKIFNAVAFARFSTADITGTANRVTGTLKSTASTAGSLGNAVAVGGVTSVRHGGDFKSGAMIGAKGQLENLSYRSRTLRSALDTKMLMSNNFNELVGREDCVVCGDPLESGQEISRLNGPDLFGYAHTNCIRGEEYFKDAEELGYIGEPVTTRSEFKTDRTEAYKEMIGDEADASLEERLIALERLVLVTTEEISRHRIGTDARKRRNTVMVQPELPPEIAPYVDRPALSMAWETGEYEYVKLAYTAGWIAWAKAQGLEDALNEAKRLELLNKVQQTDNDLRDRY